MDAGVGCHVFLTPWNSEHTSSTELYTLAWRLFVTYIPETKNNGTHLYIKAICQKNIEKWYK